MQLSLALLLLPAALAIPLDPDVVSPSTEISGATAFAKRGDYVSFSGPAANFPPDSQWISWDALWGNFEPSLLQLNGQANTNFLKDAIVSVAQQSNVIDQRAILAVVIQESSGNCQVQSTTSPGAAVNNPGLMQSHNGVSYNPQDPQGSILQMIKDGTLGTASGDGLVQCYGENGNNIYAAFRCYNSGSVDATNLSNGLGATASYVSDIANRLIGNNPQN